MVTNGNYAEDDEDADELYDEMVRTPQSNNTLNTPNDENTMRLDDAVDGEDEDMYRDMPNEDNLLTAKHTTTSNVGLEVDGDDHEAMYGHKLSTATTRTSTARSFSNGDVETARPR